ncbi:hypothetical protein AL053_18800, partial [Pseudomonas savastanoi pv. fraxini]|uniref:hypothetical protein n=1 Tax=Pseudomonas savastanoi TaxID=29438 RepID=UPI000760A499
MAAAYEGLAEVTISAEYFGAEAVKSENPQVSIALRGARRIRKKSYYKGFPIEHKPNSFCLTPLHMPDRRKKVKDCGTTNGHLELIARTLMKDARDVR